MPRILSGVALIVVVVLSVYFGAVAAAPKPSVVGPSLTIYQYDSRGQVAASTTNVFEVGQLIGVGVPNGASPPYTLTFTSLSGLTVLSQQNSTFPALGLISVSLAPTLFHPSNSFSVALQYMVSYSPGFFSPQTSRSSFTMVPAFANIQLKSFHFLNSTVQAQIGLQDYSNNPLTAVRLGLFLVQGNSSLQITTEKTDFLGRATFNVGESLAGGNYHFQFRVLDSGAIVASPVGTPTLVVNSLPTVLTAWNSTAGPVARLLQSGSGSPVQGRLLVLEEQLKDGNWTVLSTAYTDATGRSFFSATPKNSWRVSFNGDSFYSPSGSRTTPLASAGTKSRIGAAISMSPQPNYICQGPVGQIPTSTMLYLPPSAYAVISTVLTARVTDNTGSPVYASVSFYNSTAKTHLIGSGTTNSSGYASVVWMPGVIGTQTIVADFSGNCAFKPSSGQGSIASSQTPTTIELLQPQQIAYSWDLYNYYSGNGLPIVVPVNILTLALSNNSSPANIYMPPYSSTSSVPSHISGYGWAGLNQSSAVTLTMNGTYTQRQNMNWTRNFYLPPCPNPPNCSTTPRTGHMYLTASLAPPSTLYSSSSTTLNIPYQGVNSVSASNSQVLQSGTPPAHLYVNVNASYPYLSVTMQGLPISLAMYNAYLAYTLGAPTSSFLSSGYTFYALTGSTDFAYLCTDTTCSTPAANVPAYLYDYNSNGNLVYCGIYSPTNNRGMAYIVGNGSVCGYPYAYAAIYTTGNTLTLSELFHIEAVSNPSPFLTNFQGYNYAVYAPQKTGRYLLDMRTFFLSSAYTVLYPTASYSDVQYPYTSCCDIFLTVQKHPLQAQTSFNPATATILSKTNATIQLEDLATSKPLSNSSFNYTLSRSTPNPGTILSGSITTNVNGTAVISLGPLSYGNYTVSVSRSATTTLNALSANFSITIYKALPTIILRDISFLSSATPAIIRLINPAGTSSPPSIVRPQSSPFEFYEIIGGSTDVSSAHINVYYYDICCRIPYGRMGQVVLVSWSGGQRNGTIACAQTQFTNCSYSLTRLTGTSNICGTTYCYKFSVFAGSINTLPLGWYLNIALGACVNSNSNCANNCANTNCSVNCGSGVSIYCNWGYLDNPDGSFVVNGVNVRHSDLNIPVGTAVSFQFNATSSPNSITSVSMNILNQTSSTNMSVCLIGGSGCLQSARTTTSTFLLYSPSTISFKPGNYVLTVTMTCPGCVQTSIQVLSLVLVVSQSSWSENGLALSQYLYEISLVSNTTSTQLTLAGLTENIYINGLLYVTLQTDPNGNGLLTWTPRAAGQYTIKAVLPGQSYYTSSSTTIMVSVARRNALLATNNSPQSPSVNQPVTWNVYAQDMVSNSSIPSLPVSLFINGVNTTTVITGSTGYAAFNPPPFSSKGSYNITFVSATTSVYNSATIYDPLMVYLDTKLTLQAGTIILGQQNTFTISLKDANGATLSARVVQVKIDGAFYKNVTTDANSQAQFSWRPDNTGIHSVSVDFSATGSSDFAYRPSSAGLTVNVVTQTTINTVSTSITQSVNLGTALGATQPSIPYPSISITFPDPFTITVNIQYNGKAAQASSHLTNSFGLNCSWWGCLPYWNVNVDASVAGMFSLNINGPGIGIATGGSESISSAPPSDDQAFDAGATVSGAIALTAIATLASSDIASISTVLAGIPIAVGAGAVPFRNSIASYRSYLLGLLLPPLMAIPCLFASCHEPADTPLFFLLTAAYIWLTWEEVMFRVLWTAGGFVAALVLGIVIVTGSLLVTLL